MNTSFQSIKGMHDILPADIGYWQWLEQQARTLFSSYSYQEIRIPVLEKTALFKRTIGEATDVVEKEMYSFEDRNGDLLSLRPEGTAGVVRALNQHGLLYGPAQRLWYQGPMFRRERPQRGRTRQFHQIGAEVVGLPGPDVDAELLALSKRLWDQLGITGLRLEINTLGAAEERQAYRGKLVEYLADHRTELDGDSVRRLDRNPLRILDSKNPDMAQLLADAPKLIEFLGQESADYFDRFISYLVALEIDYKINPRLVRGLDYYSHTVFEWVSDDLGAQGTVCAGGRYDGLIELLGGKPWPGTGFAMGLERLVELIKLTGSRKTEPPHVYLVLVGEGSAAAGLKLAEQVREALPELRVQLNAGGGSFKAQFKRADKSGAEIALVIGEDELRQNTISAKPLTGEDREQQILPADELVQWLTERLKV